MFFVWIVMHFMWIAYKLMSIYLLVVNRLSAQLLDFIYDISVCKRNTKNRLQSSVVWCIICKG